MTLIFHDYMHKILEDYVDDVLAKSILRIDHIKILHQIFERIRKYHMRLNPRKCVFGVDSGKLLGFIVSNRGIEVDTKKIDAIVNMPPPRNVSQLKRLQGKIQAIRRFVSQLADCTFPFTQLLKKNITFQWNEDCQQAFEDLKVYLANPPILQPAEPSKPILLYIAASSHALVALLAQHDKDGKECSVYYISRTLLNYET